MMLRSQRELENTREGLRLLEDTYEEARSGADEDKELRQAEMTSLKRLGNQPKEDIARYEARQPKRL